MELPYGLTLEEVKEIIEQWDILYDEVKKGIQPNENEDYSEICEDDEYIDRYLQIGDGEYCISTEKYDDSVRVDNHYLSETVVVSTDHDPEHWFIEELRMLVK